MDAKRIEQIRQEIDEYARVPYEQRQEGDISVNDIAIAYNCSRTSARETMKRMVASGKYVVLFVRSHDLGSGKIKIVRKKT